MNKEMSLDVALDIIGTLRMMKIDEISEEKDENRKKYCKKELSVLTQKEKMQMDCCSLKFLKMCAYQSWIRYKTITHLN